MKTLTQQVKTLAQTHGVSDIFLKEGDTVWCRKNGVIERTSGQPITRDALLAFLQEAGLSIQLDKAKPESTWAKSGDKDFAIDLSGLRLRGNLYLTQGSRLAAVLRKLSQVVPQVNELGLPDGYLKTLTSSKGLVLVTGATGSGKTTTLAATLEHLNTVAGGHIITLEDPIEYLLESKRCLVDQRQIGRDTPSFEQGLRAALRQDPDIILVGELRDTETVKTALDAANTGHLVLATLHTNSAQQTIERVTSFFSAEKQDWAKAVLSQALLCVLSQVLVPHFDGGGRVLATELLLNSQDVRQLIRDGRTHQLFNVMDTGAQRGHVLLNRVLKDLVKRRQISREQALYATYDISALTKELSHG